MTLVSNPHSGMEACLVAFFCKHGAFLRFVERSGLSVHAPVYGFKSFQWMAMFVASRTARYKTNRIFREWIFENQNSNRCKYPLIGPCWELGCWAPLYTLIFLSNRNFKAWDFAHKVISFLELKHIQIYFGYFFSNSDFYSFSFTISSSFSWNNTCLDLH